MEGSAMTENNFEDDVADYKNFHDEYVAGTLTDAHPVMIMVDHWAGVVAFKYGCDSHQREDIRQEALFSLANESNYEGRCSLKGYVVRVLVSKVSVVKAPLVRVPRKPKKVGNSTGEERVTPGYVMLDDHADETPVMELADERSEKLADKVLLHLAFDTELREKIAALPELPRLIVDIVNEHEELLGRRRIAAEATKRLGRKVTRHQVNIALAQLTVIIGASLWWV
jgi:DNA-directed RNA polymerase specialized sigma24 family protein